MYLDHGMKCLEVETRSYWHILASHQWIPERCSSMQVLKSRIRGDSEGRRKKKTVNILTQRKREDSKKWMVLKPVFLLIDFDYRK